MATAAVDSVGIGNKFNNNNNNYNNNNYNTDNMRTQQTVHFLVSFAFLEFKSIK